MNFGQGKKLNAVTAGFPVRFLHTDAGYTVYITKIPLYSTEYSGIFLRLPRTFHKAETA